MSNERIKDDHSPAGQEWEEFYRNRWQYDKVVRSTHGVNCTGGCSWMVHVKDGIVDGIIAGNRSIDPISSLLLPRPRTTTIR